MSSNAKPKPRAYLALGIGIVNLAFSAIFVRVAGAPGTVTAFYRMAIAAVLITLPALKRNRAEKGTQHPRGLRIAVLGGVFFSLDLIFWTTGIDLSGAARPTLLANTAPLWVGLGSLLLFRERQNMMFWSGLILAMAGAMAVLGDDASRATELGRGTFLGLLAAVFYGAYQLTTQRGRTNLSAVTYFWIATSSAALMLLVYNLLLGRSFTGYSSDTYLIFLALAVMVQLGGWLVVNYAQGYLPASVVAPTLLAQPLLTAFFAVWLLDERLSGWHLAGGFAVVGGVYLVHRSRWTHLSAS